MTKPFRDLAPSLLVALVACGSPAIDVATAPFSLPDADALTVDLASAATPSNALAVEQQVQAPPSLNVDAKLTARALFAPLNAATRAFAALLQDMEREASKEVGGKLVYGPTVRCMVPDGCIDSGFVEVTLVVRVVDASESRFRVKLLPVGGVPDDEVELADGWTRRASGSLEGQVSIDLDALRSVGGEWPWTGRIALGFVRADEAKVISFRLSGFRDASLGGPPFYRAYTAYRSAAGVTRVRAAEFADMFDGPGGYELETERLVTDPSYGERSFSLVTNWVDSRPNGDVPYEGGWSENLWYRRSCTRLDGAWVEEWFLCPASAPLAECVAAGPRYASGPVTATWANTCAIANEPVALAEPAEVSFDPNDGSDEAGLAVLGIAAPCAP